MNPLTPFMPCSKVPVCKKTTHESIDFGSAEAQAHSSGKPASKPHTASHGGAHVALWVIFALLVLSVLMAVFWAMRHTRRLRRTGYTLH